MSLRALRTLQAIVHYGSFARAGEAVGLTQSAVSLQVKALEVEFGARLFDRSGRLPMLTEAGRIVLDRATEVLKLYDGIVPSLGDERSLSGRLRLGAIQTALSGVLPDALIALRRSHPRIRVHVTAGMSAELAQRVAAGELDAAITTEPVKPHPADLAWTALYEDRFWIIAPTGVDRPAPELLGKMPFIRFDPRAWAGRTIDRELRRMRIDVAEEMVLDDQEVMMRMVEKGLGVTIVPLTDHVQKRLALVCQPFGSPQIKRQVVLIERDSRRAELLVQALRQAISVALLATSTL